MPKVTATRLASNGVTLKILPSQGSQENLERLENPALRVDAGFVQGGVARGTNAQNLVSLGSLAYEPLLVFYRGTKPSNCSRNWQANGWPSGRKAAARAPSR